MLPSKTTLVPFFVSGEDKFHQDHLNLNISNETFYDGLSVKAATGHRCGGGGHTFVVVVECGAGRMRSRA